MAWQSLYRRYRPRRFAELVGQEHVVAALRNAVREGRVGHAYLLSGPRGTGKTTLARILARALNCERPVDGEPCLECASCLAIDAGTSYDLHELDAASNNGVDAMRDLIGKAALGTPGRVKVYILDEVHMLSPAASNSLLKTLEEPPGHVVFVLATTDPQKVLPTIRSRTQHYELTLLPSAALEAHVRWVAQDAGLDVDDAAIAHVLRAGGGSARDTLSALDQVVAAGGVDDREGEVDALLAALLERDPGAVLAAVHGATVAGRDPKVLGQGLVGRLRDAFLHSLGVPLDHLPDGDRARIAELTTRVDRPFLTRSLEVIGEALVAMRDAADPRINLETALVRLADPAADTSVAALLERIERLERALAGGQGVVPPSAPPGGAAPAAPVAPSAGPAPSAAAPIPGAGAEGGPAAEARRKLEQRRAGGAGARPRPAPVAPASPSAPVPAPAATPEAPAVPPAAATPPEPAAAPEVAASLPPAGPGSLPSVQVLSAAWEERVLPRLTGPAKARFAAGRFVGVEADAALFALPNDMHRSRCEEVRGAVEEALAAQLGMAVPLRLVVDTTAPAVAGGAPAGPEPADDEVVDVSELADAPPPVARTAAERLADAFPGAQLLSEEP